MGNFMSFLSNNKPGILMGLGLGSMVMSTVSAFLYGPMAKEAIEERKEELGTDKLEPTEAIRTVAPYVLPSIGFTAVGVGCILGGNQMNVNRGAAAMAAYAISDTAFREYREQAKKVVGEKKSKDIDEAVACKAMDDHPVNAIVWTNGGDFLCYDALTNQYFRSNMNTVQNVVNSLNEEMFTSMRITENEYCLALGINPVELGNDLGWDINETGIIKVNYTAKNTEYGEPCTVITHVNTLKYLH